MYYQIYINVIFDTYWYSLINYNIRKMSTMWECVKCIKLHLSPKYIIFNIIIICNIIPLYELFVYDQILHGSIKTNEYYCIKWINYVQEASIGILSKWDDTAMMISCKSWTSTERSVVPWESDWLFKSTWERFTSYIRCMRCILMSSYLMSCQYDECQQGGKPPYFPSRCHI